MSIFLQNPNSYHSRQQIWSMTCVTKFSLLFLEVSVPKPHDFLFHCCSLLNERNKKHWQWVWESRASVVLDSRLPIHILILDTQLLVQLAVVVMGYFHQTLLFWKNKTNPKILKKSRLFSGKSLLSNNFLTSFLKQNLLFSHLWRGKSALSNGNSKIILEMS